MNKEEIKSKIKDIIVDMNGVAPEEVTDKANFNGDLKMDSLDCFELIMEVEKEFSIHITDDEADKVSCLSDLATLVEKYQK